jgi:hypothetical protein
MNGVRVNGGRVRKTMPLNVGDQVAIGDVEYVVVHENDVQRVKKSRPKEESPRERSTEGPFDDASHRAYPSQEIPVVIDVGSDDGLGEEFPKSLPVAGENGSDSSGPDRVADNGHYEESDSQIELMPE